MHRAVRLMHAGMKRANVRFVTPITICVIERRLLSMGAARMQAGVSEVENFLNVNGLNAGALVDGARRATGTASEALTSAKPAVDSAASTLSTSSPGLIAEYILGALAIYYLVSSLCVLLQKNGVK